MSQPHPPSPAIGLVAHRGYALHYPENTVLALRAAAEAGADAVELDIQFSRDGVPVVIHDPDLQRTAKLSGRIDTLPWSALLGTSVHEPERFGERFAGEPLVNLRDACNALLDYPDLQVFIEVKGETVPPERLPDLVTATLEHSAALGNRRTLISFMDGVVPLARNAGTQAGWVLPLWSAETLAHAHTLAPDFLFCNRDLLPAGAKPLPQGSWQWAVYEVACAEEALALARRGVGWVESMQVAELRRALQTAQADSRGNP